MKRNLRVLSCLLLVTVITSGQVLAKKTPTVQLGPNAEVTFDGLHLVNKSKMDKVWVKPEIDLSDYDAVMFEGAGVHYRGVEDYNRADRSAQEFPLSDSQKSQLETAVSESFESEFRKFENFVVTDKSGRGTLKIIVTLIDVVSRIPPEPFGRGSIYIRDLGEATLVVEVFDSVTDEILARVADKQNVEPVIARESNPATNLQEVRRSVRRWGATLRKSMDELHEIGCYVCAVPGSVE
jgi:hypothetical protein